MRIPREQGPQKSEWGGQGAVCQERRDGLGILRVSQRNGAASGKSRCCDQAQMVWGTADGRAGMKGWIAKAFAD